MGNKNNKNWNVIILVLKKQKYKSVYNLKNNQNFATKIVYFSNNNKFCYKVLIFGFTSTKHCLCLNMFNKSKQVGLVVKKLFVGAFYCIFGPKSRCFWRKSFYKR